MKRVTLIYAVLCNFLHSSTLLCTESFYKTCTVHCTLYTANFTLYTVYCTLYTAQHHPRSHPITSLLMQQTPRVRESIITASWPHILKLPRIAFSHISGFEQEISLKVQANLKCILTEIIIFFNRASFKGSPGSAFPVTFALLPDNCVRGSPGSGVLGTASWQGYNGSEACCTPPAGASASRTPALQCHRCLS